MTLIKKTKTYILAAFIAGGTSLPVLAQEDEKPAKQDATPTTVASVTTAPKPELNTERLDCLNVPDEIPYLELSAKTKQGDQYGRIDVGCLAITSDGTSLSERHRLALDDAVDYLHQLDTVIRFYIDIVSVDTQDKQMSRMLRQQAFATKKYLRKKGLFEHMEKIRQAQFKPTHQENETQKKPTIKKTTVATRSKKPQPIQRNHAREYAYHVDKSEVLFALDDPTLYGSTDHAAFQFVPLESIYFPYDNAHLTARAQATLEAIADFLLRREHVDRVIINGHADDKGTVKYNYNLTDRRAHVVRDFLRSQGVPNHLLELVSKGEGDPVDENWTRVGRARNRRVELYVIQRAAAPPSQFTDERQNTSDTDARRPAADRSTDGDASTAMPNLADTSDSGDDKQAHQKTHRTTSKTRGAPGKWGS